MRRGKKFAAILAILATTTAWLLAACGAESGGSRFGESGGTAVPGGGSNGSDMQSQDLNGASGQDAGKADAPKREWVYIPETIQIDDARANYASMTLVGDTVCYCPLNGEMLGLDMGIQALYRYSLTERKLEKTYYSWEESEAYGEACAFWNGYPTGDGNIRTFGTVYRYDPDNESALLSRRFFMRFDAEGNFLDHQEVTDLIGKTYVDSWILDGQDRIYMTTMDPNIWGYGRTDEAPGVYLFDADGNYCTTVPYREPEGIEPKGLAVDADGKVFLCLSWKEKNHCSLAEIDFENAKMTEIAELPKVEGFASTKGRFAPYDFLLYDADGVYGFDPDSGEPEELFCWKECDIDGRGVEGIDLLEDGRICAFVCDWRNVDKRIAVFDRVKSELAPVKEELVIATVSGGKDLEGLAARFNRSYFLYHLEVKQYDSLTDLYNALLTGEPVDLIDLSGLELAGMAEQGIFEDLTPYLEKSALFGPEDFLDGILDVYTFGGALVGIPDTFRLVTMVGDKRSAQSGSGLTLEDFLAAAQSAPDAQAFDGMESFTKESAMAYLMLFAEELFVDWESGECNFDSPEFAKILELTGRFPDQAEHVYDEVSLPTRIQSGQVLFGVADLYYMWNVQLWEGIYGKNAGWIGFPTKDGSGGTLLVTGDAYAIASGSRHKEGAWTFVESMLGQKARSVPRDESICSAYANLYHAFPTMKATFDLAIEDRMEKDRELKRNGLQQGMAQFSDEWIFPYHDLQEREVDTLLSLVREAKPYHSSEQDPIIRIISEEAPAYYSGQKSAEAVAGIIQNRVHLYVMENR